MDRLPARDDSVLAFIRKAKDPDDFLVVVCNFTPVVRENYPIGVPHVGWYQEVFNSDSQFYGGAGPLHANAVAEIMGSFPVLVPPAPGLLCAVGDLVADFRDEFAQTYIRVLSEADPAGVATILDALGERANDWLDGERIAAEARGITYAADMRYHRQGYEIPVSLSPDEVREGGLGDLEERFNVLHEQLYGFRMNETEAEIVNLRAIGFGSVPKPELPTGTLGAGGRVRRRRRGARRPLRRRGDADEDL